MRSHIKAEEGNLDGRRAAERKTQESQRCTERRTWVCAENRDPDRTAAVTLERGQSQKKMIGRKRMRMERKGRCQRGVRKPWHPQLLGTVRGTQQ